MTKTEIREVVMKAAEDSKMRGFVVDKYWVEDMVAEIVRRVKVERIFMAIAHSEPRS